MSSSKSSDGTTPSPGPSNVTTVGPSGGADPSASSFETETEAKTRRIVHVVMASIGLLFVGGLLVLLSGGSNWLANRQVFSIQRVARADLLLMYEAQRQFFNENGHYTTDMKALRIFPKKVMFAFGFTKPADFPKELARAGAEPSVDNIVKLGEALKLDFGYSTMTKVREISWSDLATVCPDCTATETTYKVIAAANLDKDEQLDIWTIDQDGHIDHLKDDLR